MVSIVWQLLEYDIEIW